MHFLSPTLQQAMHTNRVALKTCAQRAHACTRRRHPVLPQARHSKGTSSLARASAWAPILSIIRHRNVMRRAQATGQFRSTNVDRTTMPNLDTSGTAQPLHPGLAATCISNKTVSEYNSCKIYTDPNCAAPCGPSKNGNLSCCPTTATLQWCLASGQSYTFQP